MEKSQNNINEKDEWKIKAFHHMITKMEKKICDPILTLTEQKQNKFKY